METEKRGEDPGLSVSVVLGNFKYLAFSDHLRCFDTFAYVACRCQCAGQTAGCETVPGRAEFMPSRYQIEVATLPRKFKVHGWCDE